MENDKNNFSLFVPANLPKTLENLGDSISSELEGNPPLWVTRRQSTRGEEVYINNAKILTEQSNFESKVTVGGDVKTQVSRNPRGLIKLALINL